MGIKTIYRAMSNLSRWKKIGLFCLFGIYLCHSLLIYFSVPPYKSADCIHHVDYAWQLYENGNIPDFNTGLQLPRRHSKVQFTAHHPPLYYLIVGPFVTYHVNNGKMAKAYVAGVVITWLLGLSALAIIFWSGYQIFEESKFFHGFTCVLLTITFAPFIKFTSLLYNDMLALATSTAGLALSVIIIKNGLDRKKLILLAIASLLGMSSRASYISVLGISLLSVGCSIYFRDQISFKSKIIRYLKAVSIVLGVVLVGIGWFYWNNYQMSGSWARAAPQDWAASLGRRYLPFYSALTKTSLWLTPWKKLYGEPILFFASVKQSYWPSILIMTLGAVGSLSIFIKKLINRKYVIYDYLAIGILFLQVVLLYGQQIVHATGYGAINPRYFLPGLLCCLLMLVRGFTAFNSLKECLVSVLLVWGSCSIVANAVYLGGRYLRYKNYTMQTWVSAVRDNHIHASGAYTVLIILAVLVCLTCFALFKISREDVPVLQQKP